MIIIYSTEFEKNIACIINDMAGIINNINKAIDEQGEKNNIQLWDNIINKKKKKDNIKLWIKIHHCFHEVTNNQNKELIPEKQYDKNQDIKNH